MSPRLIYGFDANGNPIVRDSTAAEDANIATLITRANTAFGNNQTFLAIANPTAAQVATQTKALTRQMNGLLHFLVGTFSDITDS